METNATWKPEQYELTCENLDKFLQNQIIYHESLNSVKRGTPLERSEEYRDTKNLISELKNLRWKASKIFVEGQKPVALPKKKAKELATA